MSKVRVCQGCFCEMVVPKNSGKKRCEACNKIWQRSYTKAWYKKEKRACREEAKARNKLRREVDIAYRLLVHSRKSALSRGLEHTIGLEDIAIPDLCPVFKVPMVFKSPFTPTLDRIDSSKGYVKDNIQVLSWKANTMKNDATSEQLLDFARWVFEVYAGKTR